MTTVNGRTGAQLIVQIGNGASPEVFTADCLINTTRGIAFSSSTQEDIVPDCDNPEDPAWVEITKDGLKATVTGAGKLHVDSIATWDDWFASDDAKNVRFLVSSKGYWQGAFKLTEWTPADNPDRKEKVNASITLASHGAVTWTAL